LMINLLEIKLMMIVINVFSYVDQDLFVDQNTYHNEHNEMVVHVYEYFEYVVVNWMKLKNFDYKICRHMVVLVEKNKKQIH
jgi:hypothetical protein